MTRFINISVFFFLLSTLAGCNKAGENRVDEKVASDVNWIVENSVDRDLDDIREDGVLKVLVVYSSTSYFLYKGQPMGFEYELLTRLAEHLDLELELIISTDLDTQFELLNRGDVDLIGHGMTITNERKWEVDFTEYLYLTRQVLVQKKPDNYRKISWRSLQKQLVHDPIQLLDDTISIRRNSSYSERMRSLANEMGGNIIIDTLGSHLSTDEIIGMVADGKIKYTIADENIAKISASYLPILKVDIPVSFSQRIAWVTRKKSPKLRQAINEWILSNRNKALYNVIYNKYFENKKSFVRRVRSDFYSLNNEQISEYDDLIKKYAKRIGWDWRLLAAQVYQESRFDPGAGSWAGAKGLMQVMPATAEALEIEDITDPEESIRGGTDYLKMLYGRFEDIPDSVNRVKFTMASYNCGYGHVRDAMRLAEKNGLDPVKWENSVEEALLELSDPQNFNKPFIKYGYVRGAEPTNYVAQIFERYEHYIQFIGKKT